MVLDPEVLAALELELCAGVARCVVVLVDVVVVVGAAPPQADTNAPQRSAVETNSFSRGATIKPSESRAPGGPGVAAASQLENAAGRAKRLARFRPVMDRRFTTTSQGCVSCLGL